MKRNKKSDTETTGETSYPLFFKNPVMLDSEKHQNAHIVGDLGYKFAKQTNSIPINAVEFVQAAKDYPIVFTNEETPMALVVVGLEQENGYVDDKGNWKSDTYIPAYARKYPFAFTEISDAQKLALCVDEEAEHFSLKKAKQASALYEDGEASSFTKNALEFCTAFHTHYMATKQFGDGLKAEGLLVENHSEARLKDKRVLKLGGFLVIDQEKFKDLSDEKIIEFHKKGWLPLIYTILFSASNWQNLVDIAAAKK